MEEITVSGIISENLDEYVLTTDDGTEYKLSAIMPWEAVPPDFDSGKFAVNLGEHVTISGVADGSTIWRADFVEETPE
ncbi:MAG: hypothetical protein ACXADO_01185 [Candidatus Thorarchaeota archaeon]